MFVFRSVRNRSFARSRHGRLYGGPENKCAPRTEPGFRRLSRFVKFRLRGDLQ